MRRRQREMCIRENTNLIGFQDHPLGHTRLVTEEGSTECIL